MKVQVGDRVTISGAKAVWEIKAIEGTLAILWDGRTFNATSCSQEYLRHADQEPA